MIHFRKKASLFHYNIGFFDYSTTILLQNKIHINWMVHPYNDRFFADPFILDVTNDVIKVLVEEFIYSDWKGRIALLTIERNSYKLITRKTVLELDTHLSFPFIYRMGNDIYVIPENSASGKLNAYRYDSKNETLQFESTLIEQPIVDPVILSKENQFILFGSINGKQENKDLYTWASKEPFANYIPTSNNPIKSDSNCSRRGGDFFYIDNELYSAVQCCAQNYGEALHICRVEKIIKNELVETIARTLKPDKYYNDGLHTFNHYKEVCVVDGLTYLFRPFQKILRVIKK